LKTIYVNYLMNSLMIIHVSKMTRNAPDTPWGRVNGAITSHYINLYFVTVNRETIQYRNNNEKGWQF